MASYFDLPPQAQAPAAALQVPKDQRDEYRGSSLLSPQVSRILDDLELDDGSSSSDEEEEKTISEPDTAPSEQTVTKPQSNIRKSRLGSVELAPEEATLTEQTSPESGSKEDKISPARVSPGKGKASKPRHANMERFKSLRSVLFLSKLEDNMNKARHEEQTRDDPALVWKAQHEKRQGLNRPATPDKEKDSFMPAKEGLTSRVTMKIRRMTSHNSPTMDQIPETAHENTPMRRRESTATDTEDEEETPHSTSWRPRASDESSIDHSDVDELVRWVSRRDPPSDGEASLPPSPSTSASKDATKSLAPSDIPSLVQHASRLSIPTLPAVQFHPDSEASTESDSEHVSSEDEDAEELVRWVSRRDGAMAGPVRRNTATMSGLGQHAGDEDEVPEMGSWGARGRKEGGEERGRAVERERAEKGLVDEDVDELVRWVSRRDSKASGEEFRKGVVV